MRAREGPPNSAQTIKTKNLKQQEFVAKEAINFECSLVPQTGS